MQPSNGVVGRGGVTRRAAAPAPPPPPPAARARADALARGPLPSVGACRKIVCACETDAGASPSRPRFSISIARSSSGHNARISGRNPAR